MKLGPVLSSSVVDSSGLSASTSFGIAANSQMFKVLSSGLYSDKISAVLREVGCNAFDAHASIGKKDVPIEVKLPTSLDRTFYIKDFGPGLDDAEVISIYSVYGISTKETCLEQTGGFGLGSKSPFAYTIFGNENPDGFSVITAKDGVQRVYVAYLNDDGAPAISLLSEEPASADWPSGVKVQFPVQEADFKEFREKAINIFKWFDTAPSFLGLGLEFDTAKSSLVELISKDEFTVLTSAKSVNSTSDVNSLNIVMANVRYPVEIGAVKAALGRAEHLSREMRNTIERMLFLELYIKVPNGSVQMTPSRESLQYDSKTLNYIIGMLSDVVKNLAAHTLANIKAIELSVEGEFQQYSSVRNLFLQYRPSIQGFIWRCLMAGSSSKVLVEHLRKTYRYSDFSVPLEFSPKESETLGFKVWEYVITKKRAFRKRLVEGYRVTSELTKETIATISSSSKATVFYGETGDKVEELLIREYSKFFVGSLGDSDSAGILFFVEQLPSGPKNAAKDFVESFTLPGKPLAGLKYESILILESLITLPETSSNSSKSLTLDGEEDSLVVKVMNPLSKKISDKLIKDIPSNQRYFVSSTPSVKLVRESSSKGTLIEINMERHEKEFDKLYRLSQLSGLQVPLIILNTSRAAKSEETLTKLGAKPFFSSTIKTALSKWSELTEGKAPLVRDSYMYGVTGKSSLVRTIMYLISNEPELWRQIESRFSGSAIAAISQEMLAFPYTLVNGISIRYTGDSRVSVLEAISPLATLMPELSRTIEINVESIEEALKAEFPAFLVADGASVYHIRELFHSMNASSNPLEKSRLKERLDATVDSLVQLLNLAETNRTNTFSSSLMDYLLKVPSNEELLASFERFID